MASHLFRSGRELALLTAAPAAPAAPERGVDEYKRVLSVNARANIVKYESVQTQLWDYIHKCNKVVITEIATEFKKQLGSTPDLTCVEFSNTGVTSPTDWILALCHGPIPRVTTTAVSTGGRYNIVVNSGLNYTLGPDTFRRYYKQLPTMQSVKAWDPIFESIDFTDGKWILKICGSLDDLYEPTRNGPASSGVIDMVVASLKELTDKYHVTTTVNGVICYGEGIRASMHANFNRIAALLNNDYDCRRLFVACESTLPFIHHLWETQSDRQAFVISLIQMRLENLMIGGGKPPRDDITGSDNPYRHNMLTSRIGVHETIDAKINADFFRQIMPSVLSSNYVTIYDGLYARHQQRVVLVWPPVTVSTAVSTMLILLRDQVVVDDVISAPPEQCMKTAAIAAEKMHVSVMKVDVRLGDATSAVLTDDDVLSATLGSDRRRHVQVTRDPVRASNATLREAMGLRKKEGKNVLFVIRREIAAQILPGQIADSGYAILDPAGWKSSKYVPSTIEDVIVRYPA
jgi:hypothetical protein